LTASEPEEEEPLSTTTCAKCGNIVRLDRSTCPACGAARVAMTTVQTALSTAALPRREDMAIQIRSHLMWGDDPAEIRKELVKQGARPGDVDGIIRTSIEERKKFYRSLGLKNVIVGSGVLVLGLIVMLCIQGFISGTVNRLPIWFFFASIAWPIAGILLLVKGIRRMRRPGEGESTAQGDVDGGH
jgi:hypothetical protein